MVHPSDAPGDARTAGRSVTSKITSILDAFSATEPELSLKELATRAGLPVSTTYRLASELVTWGGLQRVEGRGYRIGLRLLEVGSLAPLGLALNQVVVPFMQDLYVATQENVHLAVLDGQEALYIERITGHHSVAVRSRRGGRLPLHATGVGKVLLAYAAGELLDKVIDAGLPRHTPYTIVAPGHLRRTLAEIRRTGVGFAREELTVGTVSVAAPVFGAGGEAVAALSIVLRSPRVDLQRLAPAVRTAALGASRQLRGLSFPPM